MIPKHGGPGHPNVVFDQIGVLLVNLGTPDSVKVGDVRRYLREFLSDTRVIETHPLLWQIILNGFILPFRPKKSAAAYAKIWDHEANESPLRHYTRRQAELVGERLQGMPRVHVGFAMRYGQPSIEKELRALQAKGCQRIALIPLYPQYAACTTATVNDAAFKALMKMRWQPTLRVADPYYDNPLYIKALVTSIVKHFDTLTWKPERFLASFHGLPKEYLEKGDPYSCMCRKTARLLNEALPEGIPRVDVTFQSRVGPKQWLQPYTDETIQKLAREGVKRLAVITPGFAADCLETLEEIQMAGKELFIEAGGEAFTQVPCLNDSPESIDLLSEIVTNVLQGWTASKE